MEFLKDLIINIGQWFVALLADAGLPDIWVQVITLGVGAFTLALVPLATPFLLILYERKVVARIADRLGLNNSAYGGPYGLLQVPDDAIKMFTKEDSVPATADRWVFNSAPVVCVTVAVLIWGVIPLGPGVIGSDLSIGIFYILSLGAGSVVAVLMAGWGSNNEYSLAAALCGVATLISREIPLVLSVMAVVMVVGSFSMPDIIAAQDQYAWFLFAMPWTALIFLASILSEPGRRPFETVKADSEVVAGYFTAYSKFGMFYLAEFMNQLAMSILFATLFLGGWRGPFVEQIPILGTVLWLAIKTLFVMSVIQLLHYSLPRLRTDQILAVTWKFLTPLALVNICVLALAGKTLPPNAGPWTRTLAFLAANIGMTLVVLPILAARDRAARRRQEQIRRAAQPSSRKHK